MRSDQRDLQPIGSLLADFLAGRPMPEIQRDIADAEAVRAEEARHATRRAHREQWHAMFPGAGWEVVDITHDSLRPWRTGAERVLAWEPGPTGMIVSGVDSGRAKTRVCAALLYRLMVHRLVPAALWHAQDLAAELTQRASFGSDSAREFITATAGARLLFIDDLGQQATLRTQEDRVESWLFRLFDRRLQLQLPTLITTNLTFAQMADKAGALRGAPFLRRLLEMCEVVEAA